jgi:hypothetical protein
MNRRGIRIVAAQVVIVGALLLVVYLTLLQPEEHKPLFGVGVPSGPGQIAQAPGDGSSISAGSAVARGESHGGRGTGGGGAGGGPGGGHGGGHRAGQAGRWPDSASTYSGAAAQAPVLPVPSRDGGEGGLTPTEDQYDDAVSQLFGNL